MFFYLGYLRKSKLLIKLIQLTWLPGKDYCNQTISFSNNLNDQKSAINLIETGSTKNNQGNAHKP